MARLDMLRGGRRRRRVDETVAAHYESAMYAVRKLGDELVAAAANGAGAPERRLLHARIDHELARAIAAASAIHNHLFEMAGGLHHAETDRDVELWKRRLNTALTVRAQHQLVALDDAGVIVPTSMRVQTRGAYGPHQSGMDFDNDPLGSSTREAGSTATPARPPTGVAIDDLVDLTTEERSTYVAQPLPQ